MGTVAITAIPISAENGVDGSLDSSTWLRSVGAVRETRRSA